MKNMVLFMLTVVTSSSTHAQSANPLAAGARQHYGIIKGYVTRAAAKMPDELYPFRPTPEVRTFAQLIGHLADANYRLARAGTRHSRSRSPFATSSTRR